MGDRNTVKNEKQTERQKARETEKKREGFHPPVLCTFSICTYKNMRGNIKKRKKLNIGTLQKRFYTWLRQKGWRIDKGKM